MYTPLDWWFDYSIWLMLHFKFMAPAKMIAHNDEMEKFLKTFSLNGVKTFTMCPK